MEKSKDLANKKTSIFLIEEHASANPSAIHAYLLKHGFTVHAIAVSDVALTQVEANPPDLFVFNVKLPDVRIEDLVHRIKSSNLIATIPVIMCAATIRDIESFMHGVEDWPMDVILKPIHSEELMSRIRSLLRFRKQQQEQKQAEKLFLCIEQLSNQLSRVLDLDAFFTTLLNFVHQQFKASYAYIYKCENKQKAVIVSSYVEKTSQLEEENDSVSLIESSVIARSVKLDRLYFQVGTEKEPVSHPFLNDVLLNVATPIRSAGKIIGVLELAFNNTIKLGLETQTALKTFADLAGMASHQAELYQNIDSISMSDPLTGLLNRKYIMERLSSEWRRCHRYGRQLAILSIDIDGFTQINDKYGYHVGDSVLRNVTEFIKQHIRREDHFGRLGNDELLLILPETVLQGAVLLGERLCIMSASHQIAISEGNFISVTLSIGAASWPEDTAMDSEHFYKVAQEALINSKIAGGNRISASNM